MEEMKQSITNNMEKNASSSSTDKSSQRTDDNSQNSSPKNESLESALRRFKRQSSGIISEVRKREAYDKPSVRRKKKSKEARRHKKMGRYGMNKW